jgi:putative transposase
MQIDIVRRRRWCYLKHKEDGWSVRTIAKQLQVPKSTVHRWISWSIEGRRELFNLSRKPKNHFRKKRIRKSIEDEICLLRRKHLWGPDKIKGYLSKKGIEVTQYTLYSILKKQGLNRPLEKPRKRLQYIRWERENPNELWQCDWKYVKELNKWLIAYIDDHSRFIVSAGLYDNATAENAIECLLEGIKRYGPPKEILTDHGTQFYSVRRGESEFDKKLKELGIIHILSGIGKPTTTGKIERFFWTYTLEGSSFNTLEYFIYDYNHIRPHQSLEYQTPAERYRLRTVPDVIT